MLDLWFSEFHAPDAKLSILVKEQLYSEQTPFQKIDFFDSETFGKFFTLDGLIMITVMCRWQLIRTSKRS